MKKLLRGSSPNLRCERLGPNAAVRATTAVEALLVNVAFTTPKGTRAALREAARLTEGLHGSIRVIVPVVVPYPLALSRPPVSPEFTADLLRRISAPVNVDLRFEIVLCREVAHAYTVALDRNSLVIVGGGKRWWPTREARLARSLTCKGHNVLWAAAKKGLCDA